MLQYLCLFLALAATAHGQDALRFSQVLDENFLINWDYDDSTLTVEFLFNSNGWGITYLLSDDGSLLDVWWGGFDDDYQVPYLQDGYCQLEGLVPGPRYPDTFQNLDLIVVDQPPFSSTTRLRFSRLFITRDKADVNTPLNNRQAIFWGYSDNDLAESGAVATGVAYITFRSDQPAADPKQFERLSPTLQQAARHLNYF